MAATAVVAVEKKPFHESIVDVIRNVKTIEELELVEGLLMATKIPKGHDEIVAALTEKTEEMAQMNFHSSEVFISIFEQKKLAQVASAEKAAA
jgi:uncharacterized protein (UPF0128 family)